MMNVNDCNKCNLFNQSSNPIFPLLRSEVLSSLPATTNILTKAAAIEYTTDSELQSTYLADGIFSVGLMLIAASFFSTVAAAML
jgi:hypothetical protein